MSDSVDRPAFERHLQTGIQLLLIALVVWAGQQLVQTGTRVVSLEVKVTALEMAMNSNMDDRYRARDAQRDFEAVRREMAQTEHRHEMYHRNIEERIKKLEARQ